MTPRGPGRPRLPRTLAEALAVAAAEALLRDAPRRPREPEHDDDGPDLYDAVEAAFTGMPRRHGGAS